MISGCASLQYFRVFSDCLITISDLENCKPMGQSFANVISDTISFIDALSLLSGQIEIHVSSMSCLTLGLFGN